MIKNILHIIKEVKSKYTIEITRNIIPNAILVLIVTSHFALLYAIHDVADPSVVIQIIANQYHWCYEYNDLVPLMAYVFLKQENIEKFNKSTCVAALRPTTQIHIKMDLRAYNELNLPKLQLLKTLSNFFSLKLSGSKPKIKLALLRRKKKKISKIRLLMSFSRPINGTNANVLLVYEALQNLVLSSSDYYSSLGFFLFDFRLNSSKSSFTLLLKTCVTADLLKVEITTPLLEKEFIQNLFFNNEILTI